MNTYMEVATLNNLQTTSSSLELQLATHQKYQELQLIFDTNEKQGHSPFENFTDVDMIFWFIHQRKNITQSKENNARTKREYQRELKQFITNILEFAPIIDIDLPKELNGSLLQHIEGRHLRRYQQWLANESPYVIKHGQYSPATLARKTTIIKSFFQFLYRSKYTAHDATNGLRSATVHADDRPNRDLGPHEVTAILDILEKENLQFYTIILTLVTTGLRNEELCKLTLASIKRDFINGDYYFEVIGKGNKRRDVPIKPHLLKRLEIYRQSYALSPLFSKPLDAPLFCTRSGKAYKPTYLSESINKQFKKSEFPKIDQENLHITAHTFRHAYAIISHLNKVDIYDIMRSLGHEKIDTTMIYLAKVTARSSNAIHSWRSDTLGKHF